MCLQLPLLHLSTCIKGVFLVTTTNTFVSFERDLSMNTDSGTSTVHEGVSEVSERAREWSERAERCGVSERSERCERTNVASDRVALSKRDRL